MTPEEIRDRALAEFAAQAKESVIVKVLERIAGSLAAIDRSLAAIQSTHAPAYDGYRKEGLP